MLYFVPTPIGNIGDITLRTLEVLRSADTILCEDTRVTKKLLNILKERYQLQINEPKFISLHSHNEYDFISKLETEFFNQNVVYVSDAGMPCISDPGQLLVQYCIKNSVEYDILPGANAVLTAFSASGFVETQMLFFGFLAHKGSERKEGLLGSLYNGFTTVLYESPHRLIKLLEEIQEQAPERELFLAKELTKKYQTFYNGNASQILKQLSDTIRGEWVVVIEKADARVHTLSEKDILDLDVPKKSAAKLIAKITGENIKECYNRLIKG